MKKAIRTFLCVLLAAFVFAEFCFAASETSYPKVVKAPINLILNDGTLLIYRGNQSGLIPGMIYNVKLGDDTIADIKILESSASMTKAKILSSKIVPTEGNLYDLVPTGNISRADSTETKTFINENSGPQPTLESSESISDNNSGYLKREDETSAPNRGRREVIIESDSSSEKKIDKKPSETPSEKKAETEEPPEDMETPPPAAATHAPTILGYIQKVESHSNYPNEDTPVTGDFGSVAYYTTTIFVTRKYETGYTGMLSFMQKFRINDTKALTHIFGATIMDSLSLGWTGTLGLSYIASDLHDDNENWAKDATWINAGIEYNDNPLRKLPNTIKYGVTYGSDTDDDKGRMLTGKISRKEAHNKLTDYEYTYQLLYTLDSDSVFADRFTFSLDRKQKKLIKVKYEIQYTNNRYDGNKGDDLSFKISYLEPKILK